MKKWYAILMDSQDNDWRTGSYDLNEAMEMARDRGAIEIAVIEEGGDPICIEEMPMYDSFRVSTIFCDGITIDNDIVYDTGADAIRKELEETDEWNVDRIIAGYTISYYADGECFAQEEIR